MSARLATVMRLSGLPVAAMKPDISSFWKTDSRQCPSRVPGPPVFSTGTCWRSPAERNVWYSAMAPGPANVGSAVPSPLSRSLTFQTVPMPSTWPISWVITSFSVPSASMFARSAVSNDMMPLAGVNAALPADSGRRWVGPAWPRTRPAPSMSEPWARIRTSSMASLSTVAVGRSPTIILVQRSAAAANAACCRSLSPPRKRISMVNGDVVEASASARRPSARASYLWYVAIPSPRSWCSRILIAVIHEHRGGGVGCSAFDERQVGRADVLGRQRQPDELAHHLQVLGGQPSAGVGQAVLGAQRADLGGDLGVPVAGQVGEQVVLDLEAEVPGHQVEERATVQVGRAEHLPQVPLAPRLALQLLLGELHGAVREVPAEDHRVRPHVAHQVGGRVAQQHREEERAGQRREDQVVLGELAADLAPDPLELRPDLALRLLAADHLLVLQVVQRDAPLEEHREQHVVHRVAQVVRAPGLLLGQPQDAVAHVAVLADHVGVGVVQVVVRVLPALRVADQVPLPVAGVDLGVAHPVPLAVQHVVPDLHVF